jgi:hypothetical protein
MQRPGTASSGGRPQSAREGFIVRVRTDKATLRVTMASAHATVLALREAIEAQSTIPVASQLLTRERRHWFDDHANTDDFPEPQHTLHDCGIQHGDMLFVATARPAVAAAEASEAEVRLDLAAAADNTGAHRGWDLADNDDAATAASSAAPSAAFAAQSTALALVKHVRATFHAQVSADHNNNGAVDAQLPHRRDSHWRKPPQLSLDFEAGFGTDAADDAAADAGCVCFLYSSTLLLNTAWSSFSFARCLSTMSCSFALTSGLLMSGESRSRCMFSFSRRAVSREAATCAAVSSGEVPQTKGARARGRTRERKGQRRQST